MEPHRLTHYEVTVRSSYAGLKLFERDGKASLDMLIPPPQVIQGCAPITDLLAVRILSMRDAMRIAGRHPLPTVSQIYLLMPGYLKQGVSEERRLAILSEAGRGAAAINACEYMDEISWRLAHQGLIELHLSERTEHQLSFSALGVHTREIVRSLLGWQNALPFANRKAHDTVLTVRTIQGVVQHHLAQGRLKRTPKTKAVVAQVSVPDCPLQAM